MKEYEETVQKLNEEKKINILYFIRLKKWNISNKYYVYLKGF